MTGDVTAVDSNHPERAVKDPTPTIQRIQICRDSGISGLIDCDLALFITHVDRELCGPPPA